MDPVSLRQLLLQAQRHTTGGGVSQGELEELYCGAVGDCPSDCTFEDDLENALVAGLVLRKTGDNTFLSPCTELEAKRYEASEATEADSDEETSSEPEGEAQKPEEPEQEPIFDGPGEYYQVILDQMGMALLRTETKPGSWGMEHKEDGCLLPNGLLSFEHFWFLYEEAPLRKEMQARTTGQQYVVEIPRLRFVRAKVDSGFPLSSIKFYSQLDRETDPIVQQVMKFEQGIISMKSETDDEPVTP